MVAFSTSSKPTTERSSGARRPRARPAWIAPIAMLSLNAKIAVGGSGRSRSRSAATRPEAVAAVEEPLELVARLLGEDDQSAVGEAVQPVEQRDLAGVLAAGGREHDLEALLGERLGGTGEDAGEVGRIDERDEDADEPGPPGREAAGASIGGVAVLADDAADELARLVRDVAPAVEDARDGRDRHARTLRDLADRDAARDLGHALIEARSGTFRKRERETCCSSWA
jgi:hypothetical protein